MKRKCLGAERVELDSLQAQLQLITNNYRRLGRNVEFEILGSCEFGFNVIIWERRI